MERVEALDIWEIHLKTIEDELKRRGRYVLVADVWIDLEVVKELWEALRVLEEVIE